MKLGKLAPRHDCRTLSISRYLPPGLVVPAVVSYEQQVSFWPMMLNDSIGDCVVAAAGHMIQQWTAYAGREVVLTDAQILKAYCDVSGYVPGQPWTDNGCVLLDFLKYWRNVGVGGHKIAAFVSVNPLLADEVKAAAFLFGNVMTGLALPWTAQAALDWRVPAYGPVGSGAPGTWGGHCVPIVEQDGQGKAPITWAKRLRMSPNFFRIYCDECYAVLSKDWIEARGVSPSQFSFDQLNTDLARL